MAAGRDFGRLDLEAAEHFARAAAACGVRRIVYLGGLVPADAESEHLVSRKQTGDTLRAGTVAGHRAARRHHRRPRLRRLRGDPRPRLPPAGDGDAALGAVEVVAGRAREPARVPDRRRGAPRGGGRHLRRRRPRPDELRGHDAGLRRRRRPPAADHPRAGADAHAVVVLAGADHRRARQHRPRADRRAQARHPRARRGDPAPGAAEAARFPRRGRGRARGGARQRGRRALDRGRADVPRPTAPTTRSTPRRPAGRRKRRRRRRRYGASSTSMGGRNRYFYWTSCGRCASCSTGSSAAPASCAAAAIRTTCGWAT